MVQWELIDQGKEEEMEWNKIERSHYVSVGLYYHHNLGLVPGGDQSLGRKLTTHTTRKVDK